MEQIQKDIAELLEWRKTADLAAVQSEFEKKIAAQLCFLKLIFFYILHEVYFSLFLPNYENVRRTRAFRV